MVWVLLPLWLAAAQQSGSVKAADVPVRSQPAEATKEAAPPVTNEALPTEPKEVAPVAMAPTKMQSALDKQRASVRKQAGDWLSTSDSGLNDGFLIPFPKAPLPAASSIAYQILCDPMPDAELERLVQSSAALQKVSPKLVRAIIMQESGGRPCAVSNKGAEGLMQLMPEVQREMSVGNPFDPAQSVEGGVRLLKTLLDRYAGNVPKALAAYNAGAGAVDRAGGIPAIAETTNYVNQVVRRAKLK